MYSYSFVPLCLTQIEHYVNTVILTIYIACAVAPKEFDTVFHFCCIFPFVNQHVIMICLVPARKISFVRWFTNLATLSYSFRPLLLRTLLFCCAQCSNHGNMGHSPFVAVSCKAIDFVATTLRTQCAHTVTSIWLGCQQQSRSWNYCWVKLLKG